MMTLQRASRAVRGLWRGDNATFTGVITDSRAVAAGDLFVALKGERFDGHEFVAAAWRNGAVAAMVEEAGSRIEDRGLRVEGTNELPGAYIPLLIVKDTRKGLGDLAAYWRHQFDLPLVAITGSNGKTTVKEMLAAILTQACAQSSLVPTSLRGKSAPQQAAAQRVVLNPRSHVLATQGNLNNDIGVPLTLLRLRSHHRCAVIEMGMNHPGEISYLTALAKPGVALANNAAPAHLAGLGSVEAVARAKGEIFEGLGPDGIAVINADDVYAPLWRELAGKRRVVDFGLEREAAVTARCRLGADGSELTLHTPAGDVEARLQVPGAHNVRNALAAAAAAVALDIDLRAIAVGLGSFTAVKGRLQRKGCLHGATLIDDTYNANPASVQAAISVLGAAPGKKILVLGDMGELGPDAPALHAGIGTQAKDAGIDVLFTLGDLSAGAAKEFGTGGRHFERIEDLLAEVENLLAPDVTVLVKGSRFMQMERVVKSFEL